MKLKNFKKSLLGFFVKTDFAWRVFGSPFVRLGKGLSQARLTWLTRMRHSELSGKSEVESGPLKGLKINGEDLAWGTLLPKIFGLYERELHPFFQEIIESKVGTLIDVGSAEGYFAVGLALKMPELQVHAFDIDERAREHTHKLALKNQVEEQIQVNGECSKDTLLKFPKSERALILLDCEGAEKDLIDKEIGEHFKNSYFLIETHDSLAKGALSHVVESLSSSHNLELIVNESKKERLNHLSILEGIEPNREIALEALSDRRGSPTPWVVARPKIV